MPRRRDTAPPIDFGELNDLVSSDDGMRPLLGSLKDVAAGALEIFVPVDRHAYGIVPRGKYNPHLHARLCRLKLLGLTDAAAARAVGIKAATLAEWRERYPKLASDMEQAAELANAHAALILQKLMLGRGPTAFQAVKFFLTTHSPEFREPTTTPAAAADPTAIVVQIRQQIYGLPPQRALPVDGVIVDVQPEPAAPAAPALPAALLDDL